MRSTLAAAWRHPTSVWPKDLQSHTLKVSRSKVLKKKKNKPAKAFFQKERHILGCIFFFQFNFLAAVGEREQAAPLPTAQGIFADHSARYNCCFAM